MSRTAIFCCALVALSLFATASADWKVGVAISNLNSGGMVQFLTNPSKTSSLYLKNGLASPASDCVGACSHTPDASQGFTLTAGYPKSSFNIKIGGKYVQKAADGSISIISAPPPTPTSWTVDNYNRISSGGMCLDAPTASNGFVITGAKVTTNPCDPTKRSQQWDFLPSENPPVFLGHLMSLDVMNSDQMCMEAVEQNNGTVNGTLVVTPLWRKCDASNLKQKVTTLASQNTDFGTWNTGFFKISFPHISTGAKCLMTNAPFNNPDDESSANQGRAGVFFLLIDCDTANGVEIGVNDVNGDGFYTQWLWNSRAQLESANHVQGTYVLDTGIVNHLPLCISRDENAANAPINLNIQNNLTVANCSLRRFINRWNFITEPAAF